MESIVLAGGFGTRLRSSVPDLPKCLAPINDRPFLYYLITTMVQSGVERFIFSLGYRSELIITYMKENFNHLDWDYVIEDHPLGTGGGILLAMDKVKSSKSLICNGDTLFKSDVASLMDFHNEKGAKITVALKPMHDFDRYGTVDIQEDGRITHFVEKRYCSSGNINGGVYCIDNQWFTSLNMGEKFSFETDVLQRFVLKIPMFAKIDHGYFIDIGIPEDYEKAKIDFLNLF
ncbi:MAG: nucleotidyltransferase family protein [Saprospiraceae bacterium]